MDRRATELQGILARLGPSFAKVGTHCSLHWTAACCSLYRIVSAGHQGVATHVQKAP